MCVYTQTRHKKHSVLAGRLALVLWSVLGISQSMHPLSHSIMLQTLQNKGTWFSFMWHKGVNISSKNSHSKHGAGLQTQMSKSPSYLSRGLKNRGGFMRVSGARWIPELSEGEQMHRAAFALMPVCSRCNEKFSPWLLDRNTIHDPNCQCFDVPTVLAAPRHKVI